MMADRSRVDPEDAGVEMFRTLYEEHDLSFESALRQAIREALTVQRAQLSKESDD